MSSESRHVLLAVCGGIAAYKACEVLRGLQKAGCEVRVTMTADAERFVGTLMWTIHPLRLRLSVDTWNPKVIV